MIIRPKKKIGQHFLNDINIAQNIVNTLSEKHYKKVIEIGPGMGVLTQFLIKKDINLELIEIDKSCVIYLKKKYPNLKSKIIHGDFLKNNLLHENKIAIIGNFPYNISSQIIFKVFEHRNQVIEVVGMFQKEFAERIASIKKRKKGIPSILLSTFYDIKYCFSVEPNVFTPVPKVESGVIKLTRNKRKDLECNEILFIKIVKAAYNQRRKTLKNSLKSFSLNQNNDIKHLLKKRAEDLEVNDFIKLTLNVKKE